MWTLTQVWTELGQCNWSQISSRLTHLQANGSTLLRGATYKLRNLRRQLLAGADWKAALTHVSCVSGFKCVGSWHIQQEGAIPLLWRYFASILGTVQFTATSLHRCSNSKSKQPLRRDCIIVLLHYSRPPTPTIFGGNRARGPIHNYTSVPQLEFQIVFAGLVGSWHLHICSLIVNMYWNLYIKLAIAIDTQI